MQNGHEHVNGNRGLAEVSLTLRAAREAAEPPPYVVQSLNRQHLQR
jgi:hypothetical protein